MSLLTLLFLTTVVLLFYIKKKTSDIFDLVEKDLISAKKFVTHPKEVATAMGEAVVDTAASQVAKLTKGRIRKQ